MTNAAADTTTAALAQARHRELAIEHLLFGTLRFLARENPDLLAILESSLDHLWDKADDGTRDDEAVRDVARRFLKSLQAER
jgi:hypothetical protein